MQTAASTDCKLKWTIDGDQRVATGKNAEYRITEWVTGADTSVWSLAVKQFATGKITDGGGHATLQRAKEVAYSLDLR